MVNTDLNMLLRGASNHLRAGRINEAEETLKSILKLNPSNLNALTLAAQIADQRGHHNVASGLMIQALQSNPRNHALYHQLGIYLAKMGDLNQAIKAQNEAIRLNPKLIEAYHHLGLALVSQGNLKQAIETYETGIKQKPRYIPIHLDYSHAIWMTGDFEKSLYACDKLVKLEPKLPSAHYHRGNVLMSLGRLSDAVSAYKKTIKLDSSYAAAYSNLGIIYKDLLQLDKAERMFQSAVQINPHDSIGHSNYIFLLMARQLCSADKLTSELRKWYQTHCVHGRTHKIIDNSNFNDQHYKNNKKLRVGYVSYDFRAHSVAKFFEPLIKNHNKDEIEIYCYATHPKNLTDSTTKRLESYANHWRSVEDLSDYELANLINNDRIQVLIDLGGHTQGNRLKAFAYRPAPVQATYLGFFGSTGIPDIDYWITDNTLHPFDSKEVAVESIFRLPRCWVSYQPPVDVKKVISIKRQDNGIVFGCFSEASKLSNSLVQVWCTIMASLPHSKLVMMSKSYRANEVKNILIEQFKLNGIKSGRLLFKTDVPFDEYLNTYSEVDIILDTFPRSGGTTTAEALWMGVPVITVAGDNYAGRLSASKLHAIGMDELVATSEKDYIQKAINLASDPNRLEDLRNNLRNKVTNSELCDGKDLAQKMENAYKQMLESLSAKV